MRIGAEEPSAQLTVLRREAHLAERRRALDRRTRTLRLRCPRRRRLLRSALLRVTGVARRRRAGRGRPRQRHGQRHAARRLERWEIEIWARVGSRGGPPLGAAHVQSQDVDEGGVGVRSTRDTAHGGCGCGGGDGGVARQQRDAFPCDLARVVDQAAEGDAAPRVGVRGRVEVRAGARARPGARARARVRPGARTRAEVRARARVRVE